MIRMSIGIRMLGIVMGALCIAVLAHPHPTSAGSCNDKAPSWWTHHTATDGRSLHGESQAIKDLFVRTWGTANDIHIKTWAYQHSGCPAPVIVEQTPEPTPKSIEKRTEKPRLEPQRSEPERSSTPIDRTRDGIGPGMYSSPPDKQSDEMRAATYGAGGFRGAVNRCRAAHPEQATWWCAFQANAGLWRA